MKYLVKMAWTSCHPQYGKLISFLVTPYKETTPSSWGYTIDVSIRTNTSFTL